MLHTASSGRPSALDHPGILNKGRPPAQAIAQMVKAGRRIAFHARACLGATRGTGEQAAFARANNRFIATAC